MNTRWEELEFTEPERYELREGPFYHFEMNRREFGQVLGAGVLLSVAIPNALAQRAREERSTSLAQRLHIGADGVITVLTSKVEVGQGSRTQLTQAAAEELRVPVDQVRFIMADTKLCPDDGGTAGSRTTPSSVPTIRKACAAARQLLVETAASALGAEKENLTVRDGKVEFKGKTFSYADLASDKYSQILQKGNTSGAVVTEVKEWRVLGTPVPKVSGKEIVTGEHRYASDIHRPGMLYGKVLRAAAYGAKLESIDLDGAKAIQGVTAVQDGDFVGFAAATSFAAQEARDAAAKTAKWKTGEHPSSDELSDYLRKHVSSSRPRRDIKGKPDEEFKNGNKVLRQSYQIAYIQHAPMEPRAAVAEWKDGSLTVWTGSQQPGRVREDLVRAFNLSSDRVRVIVPDTGGGFGGKHSGEVAVEAARLAKTANKPVSVRWTREEEFTWAYFRPAGVIDLAGALDENGGIVAWEQINFNSGASALGTPYSIPNTASEFKSCDQPLRSGSYRALASTANVFARESFMDELAALHEIDPLEFRLRHLTNDRLRAVLVSAAERFGWKNAWKKSRSGQKSGVGLACGTEKGSYAACCVRIEIDERAGTFKALEACEAFECGAVQNPANLKAQVEGAIIQGLGGALREEMRFKEGKIQNAAFSQYHVPRLKDVPTIETVLVNRPDLASVGAGETPIIGIAPAIGNALFNATQVRIRSLPIRNANWRSA
jgi:CO/xanthine dehydrogenase Mo-binding subunit